MWNELQEKEGELMDYIEADDCLTTAAVPTLEEIADELLAANEEMEEDDDSEEIAEERPRISEKEAYNAFCIFQDYIQSNYIDPVVLKYTEELEDIISKDCMNKKKHSKITDYFKKKL